MAQVINIPLVLHSQRRTFSLFSNILKVPSFQGSGILKRATLRFFFPPQQDKYMQFSEIFFMFCFLYSCDRLHFQRLTSAVQTGKGL